MLANSLIRQGCEGTAKVERIGIVKNNKEGLRMTRVIFSRCLVFGLRFPFLKNCSYSQFPACSWLCFYMFFLHGLNKVFFKKKKKSTRLGADICLPHCLATGNGNLALKAVTGPKSRGILLCFNGLWTCDLAKPVRRPNHRCNEFKSAVQYMEHFISHPFFTDSLELTNDQLPSSVAS